MSIDCMCKVSDTRVGEGKIVLTLFVVVSFASLCCFLSGCQRSFLNWRSRFICVIFVCLSVSPSVSWISRSVGRSVSKFNQSVSFLVRPSISPSVGPSVRPSVSQSVNSISQSVLLVCLSVSQSVRPSVRQSVICSSIPAFIHLANRLVSRSCRQSVLLLCS